MDCKHTFLKVGYSCVIDFLLQNLMKSCETIGQIASETRTHAVEVEPTTGIEPNLKEFAHIQIGLNPPLESGRGCAYAMFLNFSPLYSEC